MSVNFFSTDKTFYTKEKPWMLSRLARVRVMADKNGSRSFSHVKDIDELHGLSDQIINGIIIDRNDPEKLAKVRKELLDHDLLNVSSSSPDNLELIPRRISKATAVRAISDQYGIPVERTIGFGNDMNDLEMLKAVGVGVTMGNSPDVLKAETDFTTDSNLEDGLPKFLRKYFELD